MDEPDKPRNHRQARLYPLDLGYQRTQLTHYGYGTATRRAVAQSGPCRSYAVQFILLCIYTFSLPTERLVIPKHVIRQFRTTLLFCQTKLRSKQRTQFTKLELALTMDLQRRHEGHNEVKTDQYWALGYYFENLDDKQKHQRREYLDWYGFAAQWSVLSIFVLFQFSFLVAWILKSGLKHDRPKSPSFTKPPYGKLGWLRNLQSSCQRWTWWMRKEVLPWANWGTRGEWIGAGVWTVWLLYLSVAHTGNGKTLLN